MNWKKDDSRPYRKINILRSFDPKLFVCSKPDSEDAENFRLLKGQIFFAKDDDGNHPRTIMVTSAVPGEGKTFLAANLAASIAKGVDQHALLIDCDFRRPALHNMLGCSNTEGLLDYLRGGKALPDVLTETRLEKLTLLTAGKLYDNSAELLTSINMKKLIDELKARYEDRYIIMDTAPCSVVSETNILANYVDCIIFVVLAKSTTREVVQKSIESLGNKILGIVFNGYELSSKQYHKYYKKYFSAR